MNEIGYVGYDATGRVVSEYYCHRDEFSLQAPGANEVGLLEIPEGYTGIFDYYVDLNTMEFQLLSDLGPTLNKPSAVADGVDTVTISSLPTATEFTVMGPGIMPQHGEVNDGSLELSFDTPGTYTVMLWAPGHKARELDIDAT